MKQGGGVMSLVPEGGWDGSEPSGVWQVQRAEGTEAPLLPWCSWLSAPFWSLPLSPFTHPPLLGGPCDTFLFNQVMKNK